MYCISVVLELKAAKDLWLLKARRICGNREPTVRVVETNDWARARHSGQYFHKICSSLWVFFRREPAWLTVCGLDSECEILGRIVDTKILSTNTTLQLLQPQSSLWCLIWTVSCAFRTEFKYQTGGPVPFFLNGLQCAKGRDGAPIPLPRSMWSRGLQTLLLLQLCLVCTVMGVDVKHIQVRYVCGCSYAFVPLILV